MNEDLLVEARMRTLAALSSATVHELRGAANALALHLQLLSIDRDDDAAQARRERSLAIANDERRRLFAIAETFIRHATMPAFEPADFDLATVAADCVDLARPYAAQQRGTIALGPGAETAPVHGRRDVVAQVLIELLVHALATAGRGGRVEVTVESAGTGARIVVAGEAIREPDVESMERCRTGMQWAGGTLEADGGAFRIALPASHGRG